MLFTTIILAVQLLVLISPALAGFYGSDTAVINLTPKTFKTEIYDTNYTSIVEFYAEWCGHCKNLRPQYTKAAKSLTGVAKVAAVRCDDQSNQPLCSRYNVRGYPTLKIFRPNSKVPSNPYIEDYEGGRTAKAIVDTILTKIPNKVQRLKAENFRTWIEESKSPNVLLFHNNANTPPMYKGLAIDYAGTANFGIIQKSEKVVSKEFGVTKYPTIVVVTKDDVGEHRHNYAGEHKKEPLYEFLSGFATPAEGARAPKKPKRAKKATQHEEL
ncbi:thioredoxin-like protein [Lipomyces tetrasporus]|uniref:Thioredoxin-like protein n=1 Tax=Lipomyces tetrasporus TaxID=54092 RepID=A0AAD7VUC8_9ASCO|nr:thioredoxin-like protein [Lipomyces tetrasporus]KAJ8101065.1 thioredoxin-like protein [Lipomyces tetrasporus]